MQRKSGTIMYVFLFEIGLTDFGGMHTGRERVSRGCFVSHDAGTDESAPMVLLFCAFLTNSQPIDVPDYFCCKISMDLMRDPVVTPAGYTRLVVVVCVCFSLHHLIALHLSFAFRF
jgi:hypothetical protein